MKFPLLLAVFIFGNIFSFAQENWGFLPANLPASRYGDIVALDDDTVHVVIDNGFFYKSIDGGINWTIFDSEVRNVFFDMAFYNTDFGYAVGDQGAILKTIDAGESWFPLTSNTDFLLKSVAVNAINSIWAVGYNGIILHSEDGGETWIEDNTLTTNNLHSVRFKSENEGYIAGNNGTLLYTGNAGVDWEVIDPGTNQDLLDILFVEHETILLAGEIIEYNPLYFDVDGESIYKSEDGVNWTEHLIGIQMFPWTDLIFTDPNTAFTVASFDALCECCFIYIEKSADGGVLWEPNYTERIENSQGSCNPGYARFSFPSTETGYLLIGSNVIKTPYFNTAQVNDIPKPSSFLIYPNPATEGKFQLETTIFTLGNSSIRITDNIGKQIYQENLTSQLLEIDLSQFSAGVYFVNLIQNGFTLETQKLIVR